MIVGKIATCYKEIDLIKKSMPKYGVTDALCIVGYWNKDRYVGGVYLSHQYPHDLVMEFYSHCPTIIQAIGHSFDVFFKLKNQLNAKITNDNYKSLKIAKMLGFKKLYELDGQTAVQLNKQDWRYQKRYPLN
jgi:hypothetical protein